MSDHAAHSSLTAASRADNGNSVSAIPQRTLDVVEQYRRAQISKAEAVLSIQEELRTQEIGDNFSGQREALAIYLRMLDEVDSSNREAFGRALSRASSQQSVARDSAWPETGPSKSGHSPLSSKLSVLT